MQETTNSGILKTLLSMSNFVTPSTQWNNVEPMLFFIVFMVVVLGLVSAISTCAIRSTGKSFHDNSMCNSRSGRHSIGMPCSGIASGFSVGNSALFCSPISFHPRGLFFSLLRSFSEFSELGISALSTTTCQAIGNRLVTAVFRQWLPLVTKRAYFSFASILKSMDCRHSILQNKSPLASCFCAEQKSARGL